MVTAVQSAETLQVIRMMIAVIPAVLLAGAMLAAWRYPITREKHAQIRQEIAQKPM